MRGPILGSLYEGPYPFGSRLGAPDAGKSHITTNMKLYMCQGLYNGLVTAILSSWGNETGPDMLVAKNTHHASHTFVSSAHKCHKAEVMS